jgi:hypothetical protein
MPLTFSNTPSFSSGGLFSSRTNWLLDPPQFSQLSSINANTAVFPRRTISGTIRDYQRSAVYDLNYEDFILRVTVNQDPNSPQLIAPAVGFGFSGLDRNINSDQDLVINEQFDYQFATLLPEGRYYSEYVFSVYATNRATAQEELIDTIIVPIEFNRVGASVNVIDPQRIVLSYVINSGGSPGVFEVIAARVNNDTRWRIVQNDQFGVAITNSTINSLNPNNIIARDDETVTITPTSFWDNQPVGLYQRALNIFFETTDEIRGIGIDLHVFDNAGIFLSRSFLEYTAFVPNDAPSQVVEITATGSFTITAPPWIDLSHSSGTTFLSLTVRPIPVINFSAGIFRDEIVITMGGIVRVIPVTLVVYDGLRGSVNRDGLNFTNDGNTLQLDGWDANHYMRIITSGLIYGDGNEPLRVDHTSIQPFFEGSAIHEPGKNVAKFFRLPELIPTALTQSTGTVVSGIYPRVSNITFDLKIINRQSGAVMYDRMLRNTQWMKGITPPRSVDKRGVLQYNDQVSRITTAGRYAYNYYAESPTTIDVMCNGELHATFSTTGGITPSGYLVIYGDEFEEGDTIDIRLNYVTDIGDVLYISQFIVIHPATVHSCHLLFIDAYNDYQVMQFTGKLKGSHEYERVSNTRVENNVDLIDHLLVTRNDQVIASTGFISKEQLPVVDQLQRGLKAWLMIDGREPLPVIVNNKGVSGVDPDRFLYAYEIELTINRKVDDQFYQL